jgi:hypothetical protein
MQCAVIAQQDLDKPWLIKMCAQNWKSGFNPQKLRSANETLRTSVILRLVNGFLSVQNS